MYILQRLGLVLETLCQFMLGLVYKALFILYVCFAVLGDHCSSFVIVCCDECGTQLVVVFKGWINVQRSGL